MTETGYDLATLLRPAGEARLANVRKLSRLAAAYEEREGRDLRGLLDFLAARAETDTEAQAATAAEGHDGVRIMTVHNAKGLEFEVVAVPDLSRGLLSGGRRPVLALGREQPPRVGLQWRRLGRASVNLYDYGELIEAGEARDSEEGLRLFHVAATRARERLILSGVVKPEPAKETKPGTPVVERLVDALGRRAGEDGRRGRRRGRADRRQATSRDPGPRPSRVRASTRPSPPSEIAVHLNLPSPERAAELRDLHLRRRRRPAARLRDAAAGRAQAADRPQPPALLHRDLGLRGMRATASTWSGCWGCPPAPTASRGSAPRATRDRRRGRNAAPAAPPSTPCWSGARRTRGASRPSTWRAATRSPPGSTSTRAGAEELLGPVRDWLGSPLREEIAAATAGPGRGADPARRRRHRPARLDRPPGRARRRPAAGRRLQDRPPARRGPERPRRPTTRSSARSTRWPRRRASARARSRSPTSSSSAPTPRSAPSSPPPTWTPAAPASSPPSPAISAGDFEPAPEPERTWDLCRGCPALGRLCSGPPRDGPRTDV